MIEQDTIRLLRECDAGIKMGVSSIEEMLPSVKSEELKDISKNANPAMRSLRRKSRCFW